MGKLIDGQWQDVWYDTEQTQGRFQRENSQFHESLPTLSNDKEDTIKDRFVLIVSLACPWAHRTLIFRELKGLQHLIPVVVVEPHMGTHGWEFAQSKTPNVIGNGHLKYLYELYCMHDKSYTGRVTVPVLWDSHSQKIVNNESAEIIRLFNSEFNHILPPSADYYPPELRTEIDEINAFIYKNINNGVYKAGFATTQAAYESAVSALFAALEQLETKLSKQRYLVGATLTEADWRLFTTLIRFDAVYVGHFKTNLKRLVDFQHLHNYTKELFQIPGIKQTVNFADIKEHYYTSHPTINPTRIIPTGPELDFTTNHNRASIT